VIAAQFGVDHRTVASAYRRLAREGLVEILERSGVFVAYQERLGEGGNVLGGTARWIQDVAAEAWLRHIPVTHLPALMQHCLNPKRLRCVCIESVVDGAVAVATELDQGLGVPVETLLLQSSHDDVDLAATLEGVDFVVTTVYHATAVEALFSRLSLDCPLVVASISPDWPVPLQAALCEGGLTVVHVDPRAPDRFRLLLDTGECGDLSFLSVDEIGDSGPDSLPGSVHVTVAAQRHLKWESPNMLRSTVPLLSRETVCDVIEAVVRNALDEP
jgi:hypothetical protein